MNKKLLFLVTEDWYFMSHRLSLAKAAIAVGYDVSLVTQVSKHGDEIRQMGINLVPICFPRSFKRPWQDLTTLFAIYKAIKSIKPDIVHHVALKPIVYGSIIGKLFSQSDDSPVYLNAFTGLGFVFTSSKFIADIIRAVLIPALKVLLGGNKQTLLFQNQSDQRSILDLGIASSEQCHLIPGSGVDTQYYKESDEPEGTPVYMLAARMLYDKGVADFVEAVRIIKARKVDARFVLVGDTDSENPAGIPVQQLEAWHKESVIEWWQRQENMPSVYAQAHIIVLPSHREGFPKTIIEAASCGRAVITTDVPGCRDAIIPDETGLLVPARDAIALADAMIQLIQNQQMRESMRAAGRKLVEQNFSSEVINSQFLHLYDSIISKKSEGV